MNSTDVWSTGNRLISITRLLRKLNLHPRTKLGDGGLFAYYDVRSDLLLTFRWDGSGLTRSGEIVLFEQEEPGFQPLHIQGHLTRLLFMIRSGDVIGKLVWIVSEARYQDLDKIVFPWVRIWEASFGGKFPPIEYRNENGTHLASLGVSRNAKHRLRPATAKYVHFEQNVAVANGADPAVAQVSA